jgi:hypothetical protein
MFAAAAAIGTVSGQDVPRRAQIGRGPAGGGREGCLVSVVVDGAAEVEIRGESGVLRNLSGGAPQWRDFECSRPMPPNAPGFRFTAESGRGRQSLVRGPRDGGAVVIRIEDHEGGAGEYRFELTWGSGGLGDYRRDQGAAPVDRDRPMDRDRPVDRPMDRRDSDYGQERDRFFQGEGWRRNLFQRVREDVEHLERSTIPFTGDRARLMRTVNELNSLQGKLSQGRYDERELDDVINALRAVVAENRMAPRDREILSDDLNRLRDFRERHDDYGARYRP